MKHAILNYIFSIKTLNLQDSLLKAVSHFVISSNTSQKYYYSSLTEYLLEQWNICNLLQWWIIRFSLLYVHIFKVPVPLVRTISRESDIYYSGHKIIAFSLCQTNFYTSIQFYLKGILVSIQISSLKCFSHLTSISYITFLQKI